MRGTPFHFTEPLSCPMECSLFSWQPEEGGALVPTVQTRKLGLQRAQ